MFENARRAFLRHFSLSHEPPLFRTYAFSAPLLLSHAILATVVPFSPPNASTIPL